MATASAAKRFGPRGPASTAISLTPTQGGPWQQAGRETGVVACVAVPLIKAGESVGVLMFFVGKSWAADEEIIALLARIAENVSFALDNFERANEKAKAGRAKGAADAHVRGAERDQRSDHAGQVPRRAVRTGLRGRGERRQFNSTSIVLVEPDSDYLDMVAVAGPTANNARRLKVSINEAHSGRTRAVRDGVPFPAGLHQQRFSRPTRAARRFKTSFAATVQSRARRFRCWSTASPSA